MRLASLASGEKLHTRGENMSSKTLDGQMFVRMVSGGAANLKANASIINDLNVFPIPDGDTGENMSLTIGGGLRCLEGYSESSIDKAAALLADGMLLSARGNSGVILSQLFSGIAGGLRGKDTATVTDLAEALKSGVKQAYAAVINPTEGTILTVAREAAEFASSRITEESTIESFGEDYLKELDASLQRTPELLDSLKEAGVIDSGGAGLYYIVDGIIKAANGEQIGADITVKNDMTQVPDISKFNENSVMEFGYCTEFLLQLQTCKGDISAFSVDELIAYLETIGDSIVAFQTGSIVKVHIHTMSPGIVITHCQKYGEFLTLKVENMTLQHHETAVQNRFPANAGNRIKQKKYAVVVVAAGDGIKKTFYDLGADVVLDGGQGNKPSTEDFTKAFDKANAATVFVLPNNKNIVMAARQAAELYKSSNVFVIESKNVGEGYAALTMLSYDSDDAQIIFNELTEATKGVKTGTVTKAVRNAQIDGIVIKENEYIGFTDKRMLASDSDKCKTAMHLLQALQAEAHEFLIVIYGSNIESSDRSDLTDALVSTYPNIELYEIYGGPDAYDYTFILE